MAAAFKQWVMVLQPRYAVEKEAPFEPEQEWLLGNRWADYGLACLVAFAFPFVRGLLRTHIYEVRTAAAPWTSQTQGSGVLVPALQCRLPVRRLF